MYESKQIIAFEGRKEEKELNTVKKRKYFLNIKSKAVPVTGRGGL
jgi:hypothetical protein